jgi:hypothetical protein
MTTLSSLSVELATNLSQAGHPIAAAGGGAGTGIIDWLTGKNAAVQTLGRGFSITAGIIFVIYQAFVSRGAMARIIIAGIAAGIFVWIVWNVTGLKDRVDTEVNTMRAPVSYSQTTALPPPLAASSHRA